MRSARTPRCASMNVSAALYRLPDPTPRIIALSPAVLARRLQRGQLPQHLVLADGKRAAVPECRCRRGAETEIVLRIGLGVLKVDLRLQSELDDPKPDARARRL